MSVWHLAETLRAVSAVLTSAEGVLAGSAVPSAEEARSLLLSARGEHDDFHPVEFDLAVAELTRAAELVARARETIDDYRTRL